MYTYNVTFTVNMDTQNVAFTHTHTHTHIHTYTHTHTLVLHKVCPSHKHSLVALLPPTNISATCTTLHNIHIILTHGAGIEDGGTISGHPEWREQEEVNKVTQKQRDDDKQQ